MEDDNDSIKSIVKFLDSHGQHFKGAIVYELYELLEKMTRERDIYKQALEFYAVRAADFTGSIAKEALAKGAAEDLIDG